jgi:hypothetical protein
LVYVEVRKRGVADGRIGYGVLVLLWLLVLFGEEKVGSIARIGSTIGSGVF